MKYLLIAVVTFCSLSSKAQNYTSYFTGDTADVNTQTSNVVVLMGGATEQDTAMVWFLEKSGGGDILVLRASGSDGYNDYMYTDLGVNVNSVQTIVFNNATAATDPYIIQQVYNAEAIWFAGGDQWNYVSYWNNTALDTAFNYLINVKKIPFGGTSAGMAILGANVFTAQNGSVTSATALANPFDAAVTISENDFIHHPLLENVITDTHYDNPNRQGRHTTFLARLVQNSNQRAFGIACNEYVAVCIDTNGIAKVYGDYPNYQEFAYFLQANCEIPFMPEICSASLPLTWDRNQAAVKVYKVPGTLTGDHFFDLNQWNYGIGGEWQNWYVQNGVFLIDSIASPVLCTVTSAIDGDKEISVNMRQDAVNKTVQLELYNQTHSTYFNVYNTSGQLVLTQKISSEKESINYSNLPAGIYMIQVLSNTKQYIFKAIF